MRIFMFKSETKPELHAFAQDESGETLPKQFSPWLKTGVVADGRKPPFSLPREDIEGAIKARGFQLWRMTQPAKTA